LHFVCELRGPIRRGAYWVTNDNQAISLSLLLVVMGPCLRRYIETEVPKWRDVIAKAGIKPV